MKEKNGGFISVDRREALVENWPTIEKIKKDFGRRDVAHVFYVGGYLNNMMVVDAEAAMIHNQLIGEDKLMGWPETMIYLGEL